MNLYRSCIRPILFRIDPERIHEITLTGCQVLGRSRLLRRAVGELFAFDDVRLRTTVAGIDFPNPIGLAAGFDKNGVGSRLLPGLGFGFIEVGSISAFASPGNQIRPRLFRLPADEGLMVYYGVPNEGAEIVAARLVSATHPVPLGISLVETNRGSESDVEEIIAELAQAARPFLSIADYLVLNLNCPNSGGGVSHFDEPSNLARLLDRFRQMEQLPALFLKVTPPSDSRATDQLLAAVEPFAFVKGFILNTHAPRPYVGLNTPNADIEAMRGSLTGARLRKPVNDVIRNWYHRIDRSRHVLVGVGGIASAEDAYQTIRLGASLIQVLTGLVYSGPGLVKGIKRGLARLLERDGMRNVAEAVGVDNYRPA